MHADVPAFLGYLSGYINFYYLYMDETKDQGVLTSVVIKKIAHYFEDKERQPLFTQSGKPFIRAVITSDSDQVVTIMDFSGVTLPWKQGQTVELNVKTNTGNDGKTYYNGTVSKNEPRSATHEAIARTYFETLRTRRPATQSTPGTPVAQTATAGERPAQVSFNLSDIEV